MKRTANLFLWWLPAALVITLFAGMLYVTVQQVLRQDANDPQIQVAEDMADLLSQGIAPQSLISTGVPIDVSRSLATYAVVFDASGTAVLSTANLHGQPIALPPGVLEYAKKHGEDRLTWQPEVGVRSAVVMVYYSGTKTGFVLVGRSLREVEIRENNLSRQVLIGWLAALIVSFIAVFFIHRRQVTAIDSLQ
jgi:hypothetical protein